MEIIEKTIKSKNQPKQTNVAWVDLSGETPVEKHFINGRWVPVSGGGGGTNDYETLDNLPKINRVMLTGDKSSAQLGLPKVVGVSNMQTISGDVIDSLNVGDIITYDVGVVDRAYEYNVVFKDETGIVFIHIGNNQIDTISYYKHNNQWIFEDVHLFSIAIPKDIEQPVNGMNPNILYNLGALTTDTTFTMAAATDNTIANIWTWTFSTGSTAPTITWPAQITMWNSDAIPEIEANKYYEVNVMNGVGAVISADIPQEEETEVEP